MKTIIVIIVILMDCADSQYPDCADVTCPDGSVALSPLSYNTMRSHVFNGTKPSNEGCTNGVSIDGQVTIDCGQGTTLIDCNRGYNDNADYSDLSNYFIWNRTTSVAQQVSIVFRFYQQIRISRISMFFWNSPTDNITIPTVTMSWSDYSYDDTIGFNDIRTINTKSLNRTNNGRYILNFDINNPRLQFQYLIIKMKFYNNSEWIFLSEVQFCGNQAPYHITQPSTDYDVQIVSSTATMANLICSLNVTIPSSMAVGWIHNVDNPIPASKTMQTGNTTTLLIGNLQQSDAGVYQCAFYDDFAFGGSGWTLRRNIRLLITTPNVIYPTNDSHIITVNNLMSSVQLMCSLNVTIPSSMTVTWSHNGSDIMTPPNEVVTAGNTATLVIANPQPSDAGVYQCVFTHTVNGWMLKRNTLKRNTTVVFTTIDTSSTAIVTITTVTTANTTSTTTSKITTTATTSSSSNFRIDIATASIATASIATASIATASIATASIATASIATAITATASTATASISTASIVTASIPTASISTASIATVSIATTSIATASIPTASIATANIATASTATASIATANIATTSIATASIPTASIATANIATASTATASITTVSIPTIAITTTAAADNSTMISTDTYISTATTELSSLLTLSPTLQSDNSKTNSLSLSVIVDIVILVVVMFIIITVVVVGIIMY